MTICHQVSLKPKFQWHNLKLLKALISKKISNWDSKKKEMGI